MLDPLDPNIHLTLTRALYSGRQYEEALRAANAGLSLEPASALGHALRGLIYYALGRYKDASASCEGQPGYPNKVCLAVSCEKLERHTAAESQRAKMQATLGAAAAFQYAEIYAQWGDTQQALRWLDIALRLRDSGLAVLKVDRLLDPLREEPRFQAIERVLKLRTQGRGDFDASKIVPVSALAVHGRRGIRRTDSAGRGQSGRVDSGCHLL